MNSQVLHAVGDAAGEIWNWLLLGESKGLTFSLPRVISFICEYGIISPQLSFYVHGFWMMI